jgi:hypothetical protein
MWHCHFVIDFMTKQCNHIIYIYLHIYYLDIKINISISIIDNSINFNLYHVDMCHHLN